MSLLDKLTTAKIFRSANKNQSLHYSSLAASQINNQHVTTKVIHGHRVRTIIPDRSASYVTMETEILDCDNSKELLSVASRKTHDFNFNGEDLVLIFENLANTLYSKDLLHLPWLHASMSTAFLQLTVGNKVKSELQSRLQGPELNQLLSSLLSHADDLETGSLISIFQNLVYIGIPTTHEVYRPIFYRIMDKNTELALSDLSKLYELKYHELPDFFIAQFILPKLTKLINSGGLDEMNKEMFIYLLKVLVLNIDLLPTELVTKCTRRISSLVIDDDVFQHWECIFRTMRWIHVMLPRSDYINNEMFRFLPKIVDKDCSILEQHIEDVPYHLYTELKRDDTSIRNTFGIPHSKQVERTMFKNCLSYFEKENLIF